MGKTRKLSNERVDGASRNVSYSVTELVVLIKHPDTGKAHQIILNEAEGRTVLAFINSICGGQVKVSNEAIEGIEFEE